MRMQPITSYPKLEVRLTGPAVGPGRLAARDLAELARRLDQALKRIGQVLYGGKSRSRGRSVREIEELCRLYLVSWREGSAVAGFDLSEPPAQLALFGHIGENSLECLLAGLARIDVPQPGEAQLPEGFDAGVLEACDSLGHLLDHGIDAIGLTTRAREAQGPITYTASTRERIRDLIQRPQQSGEVVRSGRLEVLNGHQGLGGALWQPNGTRLICRFKPEHLDILPDAWLKTVTVRGKIAIEESGRTGAIDVMALSVGEDHGDTMEVAPSAPEFWRSAPLDELIAGQAVAPVSDLAELDAIWSEGDVFDDALTELIEDRAQRRRVRKTRAR